MDIKLASTGSIIKMYLQENGISLLQLAEESGVSLRSVLRVVNDEKPLGYKIALGINKLIPEIKADFLLSYDAKYQLQRQLISNENNQVDISKVVSNYHMKKLYNDLADDELALFEKAKRLFGLENILDNYKVDVSNLSFCFSLAKGTSENNHLVWVKAAYEECLEQNGGQLLQFDRESFNNAFLAIKKRTFTTDIDSTFYNMKSFCIKCGINFYQRPSIPGARVKAVAVKDKKGFIYIFVSDLFKCIENLWLSFIHECIHIKNNDFDKIESIKNDFYNNEINESYVDEEAIAFFVGHDYSISAFEEVDSIIELAEETNTSVSIVAEIARFKTKNYKDIGINKYIHYYK